MIFHLCVICQKRPVILEGFEVEVAQKLADKLNLELEIVDTSEKNLLKSLDADLYDCVISAVGISDWNDTHYDIQYHMQIFPL